MMQWMEEILHQSIGGLSNYLYRVSIIQDGAGFLPSTIIYYILYIIYYIVYSIYYIYILYIIYYRLYIIDYIL